MAGRMDMCRRYTQRESDGKDDRERDEQDQPNLDPRSVRLRIVQDIPTFAIADSSDPMTPLSTKVLLIAAAVPDKYKVRECSLSRQARPSSSGRVNRYKR